MAYKSESSLYVLCPKAARHKEMCPLLKKWREISKGRASAEECTPDLRGYLQSSSSALPLAPKPRGSPKNFYKPEVLEYVESDRIGTLAQAWALVQTCSLGLALYLLIFGSWLEACVSALALALHFLAPVVL